MNEHLGIFLNNTTSILKKSVNLNNFIKLSNDFAKFIIIDVNNEFSQLLKNDIDEYINIGNNKANNKVNTNNVIVQYLLDNELYDPSDFDIKKIKMIINKPELLKCANYSTFIHDKYIYTDSIKNYLTYISSHSLDFSSFVDSFNNKYEYKYETFIFTIKNINENINKMDNILNYIDNSSHFNINKIHENFSITMPYLKVAYLYKNSDRFDGNFFFNDIYEILFIQGKLPIVSIDKLLFLKNNYKYIYGFFTHIPDNFDINIYRESVPELINSTDNAIEQNFINQGQFLFKRYSKYKNYINYILPDYLRNVLLNIELLYFFDVPDNFNIYKYKEKNGDLNNLNESDLVLHWINYGCNENRIYF
jgi:hypothetical protein